MPPFAFGSKTGSANAEPMEPVGAFGQTIELRELLASGSSASVYRCVEKSNGRALACKMSRREACKWPWDHILDMYEREARFLRKVQGHPNIVQFAGLYDEPYRVYMVMELVPGADLHTVLTRQRCLSEDVARAAFTQLASAIDHMHSCGIVHRDIKLENVLYNQHASPAVIKVCDLGNSMLLASPARTNFKGTNGYTAPEIGDGHPSHWGKAADVWALGVVLYAMLGGYLPFDDARGRHAHHYFLDFSNAAWWSVSVDAKLLIQSMLTVAAADRAPLGAVIDSAWLAGVDPSRLPNPAAPPTLHPVASLPAAVSNLESGNHRLALRSYRKPSAGGPSAPAEDAGTPPPPSACGPRPRVSVSCTNLAAMDTSGPGAGPGPGAGIDNLRGMSIAEEGVAEAMAVGSTPSTTLRSGEDYDGRRDGMGGDQGRGSAPGSRLIPAWLRRNNQGAGGARQAPRPAALPTIDAGM